MHHFDPWIIALAILALTSVLPALVLPFISVFATTSARLSLIFAAFTGGSGLLALGIAALARAVVGSATHPSDYHGVLVVGLAIAIPTLGAACIMVGRSLTTKRVWKVIGSAFLVALGTDVALFCLLIHQFMLADRYRSTSASGLIFFALFAGIPLAVVGLVFLATTSAKAAKAEAAAVQA